MKEFFELESSARKASQPLGLSYLTVFKAFHLIRQAITAHTQDGDLWLQGEIKADETYFGGRQKGKWGGGARGKVPVFDILKKKGFLRVEPLKDVSAKSILNLTLKIVRRGSIVYTDKFRRDDALMVCGYGHLRIDHGKRFSGGKVYLNGLEGFWSYAKEIIIKFMAFQERRFLFI